MMAARRSPGEVVPRNQSTQPLATTRARNCWNAWRRRKASIWLSWAAVPRGWAWRWIPAARGFVVLLESLDFAKGTSSRATKLVHGGVRYLAQGKYLPRARSTASSARPCCKCAPHLAPLAFVMPSYKLLDTPFTASAPRCTTRWPAKAGPAGLPEFSQRQDREIPADRAAKGLKGGVNAGMVSLTMRAWRWRWRVPQPKGAADQLLPGRKADLRGQQIAGLICRDAESGRNFTVRAKCVVNTTGPWVDLFRQRDARPGQNPSEAPWWRPARACVVVDREFLPRIMRC